MLERRPVTRPRKAKRSTWRGTVGRAGLPHSEPGHMTPEPPGHSRGWSMAAEGRVCLRRMKWRPATGLRAIAPGKAERPVTLETGTDKDCTGGAGRGTEGRHVGRF